MTIHDEIDNYLAADLHSELSDEEQNALHLHLVECASCRQAHQENKIMNKVLEEKLANEKPDVAFEQRMLAGFRNRIPQKTSGVAKFIVDLMRLRATQVAAVAAVLLALVQVGRMITHEGALRNEFLSAELQERSDEAKDKIAPASGGKVAAISKSAAGSSYAFGNAPENNRAVADATLAQREVPPEFHEESAPPSLMSLPAPRAKSALIDKRESEAPANEGPTDSATATPVTSNRKLIRNAQVELEIVSFDDAVQKITAFANEDRGYIATTSSQKQANGKLKGEIVVKVLPENLDRFLQKLRGLGELKNQTLGTEDITKAYFDTDARLKNARVMEQRLIDMLKKKSDDINDLLQVEKELGRVREQIEQMQGELKFWDSQVQFATVTISLAEKDMEEPAKFLLKERAQLALYTPEVEKVYNDLKALASPKVQITNAQLDRDNTGRVSARVSMLIAPEESDGVIAKAKAMGRVENFQVQTDRVAQGGEGMSENAKTKRDKVALNISISRDEQEQAFQQTTLRIRTSAVDEKAKKLRDLAGKQGGRVRASSFSRDPDGREYANVTLRVPMKNYNALIQSLDSLGKVENVSVQRQDRDGGQIDEANAPADLSIQVYSQGNIVSSDTGLFATLRRTIWQSAGAIMWSLRMIGVAIAFLAPWVIALVGIIWLARRIRSRR
jgi:anti-sigma factor RsiW